MKKLIYTVVTGNYDTPKGGALSKEFDHVIFTDNPDVKLEGWKTILVPESDDPKKLSREIKINVHKFIDGYNLFVYVDANYRIERDLNGYIDDNFRAGFLAHNHPKRNDIYQEAKAIVRLGKDSQSVVADQVAKYKALGVKVGSGLYQNGFFIRDNTVNGLCEAWYNEVEKYSYRDQLSLPVVARNVDGFRSIPSRFSQYLTLVPHEEFRPEPPTVYYFRPMCGDKTKYGSLLNNHCESVPNDDDWICITDQDTCFLHEFTGKLIEDVIIKHGKNYDLFGCVTNRLGLSHQTPFGISKETDMIKHREIAVDLYERRYSDVLPVPENNVVAGMFMLFKKSTWENNKFIDGIIGSDGRFFDWHFSQGVKRKGIIQGLYLFHYYRLHKRFNDWSHLR